MRVLKILQGLENGSYQSNDKGHLYGVCMESSRT